MIDNLSKPATAKDLVETLKDKYSQATVYRRIKELSSKSILKEDGDQWVTTY